MVLRHKTNNGGTRTVRGLCKMCVIVGSRAVCQKLAGQELPPVHIIFTGSQPRIVDETPFDESLEQAGTLNKKNHRSIWQGHARGRDIKVLVCSGGEQGKGSLFLLRHY